MLKYSILHSDAFFNVKIALNSPAAIYRFPGVIAPKGPWHPLERREEKEGQGAPQFV